MTLSANKPIFDDATMRNWTSSSFEPVVTIETGQEQGIHHRPTGDLLHYCRQASDPQLLTSWVNPEQEARPCHVCPRAVGEIGQMLRRQNHFGFLVSSQARDTQQLSSAPATVHDTIQVTNKI